MADNDLRQELARALVPGPVEPPPERVEALRSLVGARPALSGNGAAPAPSPLGDTGGGGGADMVDDLARALRVGDIEPPPARIRALRDLVGRPPAAGGGGDDDKNAEGMAGVDELAAARARRRSPDRLSRTVSGMMAAAAVALLVAMVAVRELPQALREVAHGVGLPVDSPELVAAEDDVDHLELALARRDAGEVAEADADMLRSTSRLAGGDLQELRDRAVRLHVEALAFLRDHPTPGALSDLPSAGPAPGTALPPEVAAPAPPGSPPAAATSPVTPEGSTTNRPTVPTTVAPQARSVRIVSISPRLDASFQVDFEVTGFTPGPGQPYAVHFFFDSGQDVSSYSGSSPWTFPLLNAVKYRTLCAQVADGAGVRDPASGNCHDILLR